MLLYVHDMLVTCKDMAEIEKLKSELNKAFEMKNLGAAKRILGMEIRRNRSYKELFLSQRSYLEKVIQRYSMTDCKPVQFQLANTSNYLTRSPKTDQ